MKLFLLIIFFFTNALAGELFQPGLQTRCFAMGGTCASHVRGASALFFNPAALARVEGFDFTIAEIQTGVSKDAVDFSSQLQGTAFTTTDLNKLYGKTLTAEVTARSGFVMPNLGFGVFSNSNTHMQFNDPTFPTFKMNFISDYGYILGGAFSLGGQASLGASMRYTKRWGGEEDINMASLIGASTNTLASNNFINHGVGHALDIAAMTTLNHPLKPTVSLVWQDVGVTTYNMTSGVKNPPSQYDNLILGIALPQEYGIVSFTHAIEYKFIRTEGYDFFKKIHLGTEASIGPLDLRAGINQGYITYGAAVDVWLVQVEAAAYATELGTYGGQGRSDRYSVGLSFNMDFDQSFKIRDSIGKKRRLKQRR